MATRRDDIARAAMELVADGGTHALTHRRIDRRLGLPEGTTSNYARTRRDLVRMVVDQVARTAHLRPDGMPLPTTVSEAVEQLTTAFDVVADRGVDIRARMALAIECRDDLELHRLVTIDSPVRAAVLEQARAMLVALDVPQSEQLAVDLVAILNGLFYDRLVGHGVHGGRVDPAAVLAAWLTGVRR